MNPVILFLALFIGERVAGLLGVFLSIPIAGMIGLWMQSTPEKTPQLLEETPADIIELDDVEPSKNV